MSEKAHFTAEEARSAGERIGIDWTSSSFDVEQFRIGMDVELEHGTQDPETNVTDDDIVVTAKIARAHLNEFPGLLLPPLRHGGGGRGLLGLSERVARAFASSPRLQGSAQTGYLCD